ncbi:aminoacyl-histidine dipeptidase [Clostridium cylindrosporum]|uniref:Cytosol non-specific dipeptidase n=1 Tax=Clostridium cylindrosporum DSM 605 TaxID=1121307 RepID=A0A0J8DB95_CLOCY|nr:aminoacyl-histidine dipeptidase [Clostridium cylindrosporum]KMT23107.1 cytosol non-specific dipeptidase PepD [Clostridium cylindrosporum DSM 605]
MILENLEPKSVFKYFEEISNIPRGSKNEKAISDYLVSFAKKHSLEFFQDKHLNVIIKKNATKGYENSKGVILQGHMDMVCEKNNDTSHNFLIDPIKPRIIDDMIYATNTTLGADNGVAIAYALAILESNDIPHPPLEVLITTEEEVGMGGAMNLDPSLLSGKYLINIDSEEDGSLLVSCCGGVRTCITIDSNNISLKDNYKGFSISISGLKGGHSGMDITKQRGNSNKLMGRILSKLLVEGVDFFIKDINGGSKMNAIPRECSCNVFVEKMNINKLKDIITQFNIDFKNELQSIDDNINVSIIENSLEGESFDKETTNKIVNIISLIPNGVMSMSNFIDGLAESSTNLGIVETSSGKVLFESAIRSSISSLKQDILNKHIVLSNSFDAKIDIDGDYPEWEFSKDSYLRNVFVDVFKDMFNKEPIITAIHAGLECGILKSKLPELDIISFGPDHFDVHSPNEHLSIPSTKRMWKYLLEVLKRLK